MPKLLSAVALGLGIASGSASAADLANRSRLGEVFAEPQVVVRGAPRVASVVVVETDDVRNSPQLRGYYGQAGDFHYRNYYGTPRPFIGRYLPYACVVEALC